MLGLAKYPGGKQRVAQRILRCLPSSFDAYVEPFCGNSPFLQPQFHHYLDPCRKRIWLNDLSVDIYNVLQSLKNAPDRLINNLLTRKNRCQCIDTTVKEFNQAKTDWIEFNDSAAYLFLRRLAVAQVVLRERPSLCSISARYANPIKDGTTRNGMQAITRQRLETAAQIAQQVDKITNLDFREVLLNLPEKSVAYLDPPYWVSKDKDWYDHSFDQQDHIDLCEILKGLNPLRHKFLMSIEISELSKALYVLPDCFFCDTLDMVYTVPKQGTRRIRELLVANYRF